MFSKFERVTVGGIKHWEGSQGHSSQKHQTGYRIEEFYLDRRFNGSKL